MTSIIHLNSSTSGGAGRAAYRIYKSIASSFPDLTSRMLVKKTDIDDISIEKIKLSLSQKFYIEVFSRIEESKLRRLQTASFNFHSTGYPGARLVRFLASEPADILHIHSVGDGLLSIEDIPRIKKRLVWTMHDEWGYCGAEHYSELDIYNPSFPAIRRNESGYTLTTRPPGEMGPDINRLTWRRKVRAWKQQFQIVCPSQWLADCARRSKLMSDWPIAVIPNPICSAQWSPIDRQMARSLFGLPQNSTLVLFGVDHGSANPRKGADLLLQALRLIKMRNRSDQPRLQLVVFGQQLSLPPSHPDIPYYYLGRLHDDVSLRALYSAVDLVVIPSRQDNLPNIGLEAQACGIPVVAFRTGGLSDIVEDRVTGALAVPFDSSSLAEALLWVIDTCERSQKLGEQARLRAKLLWDQSAVAEKYHNLYLSMLAGAH